MARGSHGVATGIAGGIGAAAISLAMLVGGGGRAAAAGEAACGAIDRATFAAVAEGVAGVLRCYALGVIAGSGLDEPCLLATKTRLVRALPDASGCEARLTGFADRVLRSLEPSPGAQYCAASRLKAVRSFALRRIRAAAHRPGAPGSRFARAAWRAERRLARQLARVGQERHCTGAADLETLLAATNTFLAGVLGNAAGLGEVREGTVRGWARVADPAAAPAEVRIYVDGPAGTGVFAGAVVAKPGVAAREQTRTGRTRADRRRGAAQEFAFTIPARFADGNRHSLRAYLVEPGGAAAPVPGGPVEFRIGEGVASGPEEVVFDWTTDHCGQARDYDIPDLPVRAFRDSAGQVQLVSSHHTFPGWRMTGPDLRNVVRDCAEVMHSHESMDPTRFDGYEWIASPYTPDGRTVYALVHNEFQGYRDPARCPSGEYPLCWYNAITFAVSTDGGRSYTHAPAPAHLVASLPYRYTPDAGPSGVFEPSSIVHDPRDGYYYVMTLVLTPTSARRQTAGTCVLRTATPADPGSWRAWGGPERGFTVKMGNPYDGAGDDGICQPVSPDAIAGMHETLKFSSYFGKFLLVGLANRRDAEAKRDVWGVYYALSDDLITWSERRLIFEARPSWLPGAGADAIVYPSVLDPDDPSRNFEVVGRRADLYFTRWNPKSPRSYDRDLVRVPIEFL